MSLPDRNATLGNSCCSRARRARHLGALLRITGGGKLYGHLYHDIEELGVSFAVSYPSLPFPVLINFNVGPSPTWSSFTVSRRFVLPLVQNIGTPEFRRRAIGFIPWKKLHLFRDMCDLLYNTSLEIYRAKKNAYLEGQHENASQGSGKEILALICTRLSFSMGFRQANEI
jgi:hypothetical protein